MASTAAAALLPAGEGWRKQMSFVACKNPEGRQNMVSPIRCSVKQLGIRRALCRASYDALLKSYYGEEQTWDLPRREWGNRDAVFSLLPKGFYKLYGVWCGGRRG